MCKFVALELGNSSNFYVSMYTITNSSNFSVQGSCTDDDEFGTYFVQSAGNIVTLYISNMSASALILICFIPWE
jgi:hypothetical protein